MPYADIAQERAAMRERANGVAKMYLERAVLLQQQWESQYIKKSTLAMRSAGGQTDNKTEGSFSVAAAVSFQDPALHCASKHQSSCVDPASMCLITCCTHVIEPYHVASMEHMKLEVACCSWSC